MGLVEYQVVKVIGEGEALVGWAVVLDEGRHVLVPGSYLEAVRDSLLAGRARGFSFFPSLHVILERLCSKSPFFLMSLNM